MSKYTDLMDNLKIYEKILHPDFFLPIQVNLNEYRKEIEKAVISDFVSEEELQLIEDIREYRKKKNNKGSGISPNFFLKSIIKRINEQ